MKAKGINPIEQNVEKIVLGIAGAALEQRFREDQVFRRTAVAIGIVHVLIGQHVDVS